MSSLEENVTEELPVKKTAKHLQEEVLATPPAASIDDYSTNPPPHASRRISRNHSSLFNAPCLHDYIDPEDDSESDENPDDEEELLTYLVATARLGAKLSPRFRTNSPSSTMDNSDHPVLFESKAVSSLNVNTSTHSPPSSP